MSQLLVGRDRQEISLSLLSVLSAFPFPLRVMGPKEKTTTTTKKE
jgi:hypothetical protein